MFYSLSSFWVHIKRDTYRSLADQGEMLVFYFPVWSSCVEYYFRGLCFISPCCWEMRQAGVHLYWDLHPLAKLIELGSFFFNWNIKKSAVFFKTLISDAEQNIECLVFSSRRGKYQISQDGINMCEEIKICEFHQICSCGSFMAKLDVYIHLQARKQNIHIRRPSGAVVIHTILYLNSKGFKTQTIKCSILAFMLLWYPVPYFFNDITLFVTLFLKKKM